VLSAPTETSVRFRLVGVNQWPATQVCLWTASGVGADGETYTWHANLVGDGLVDRPDGSFAVDVSIQFNYEKPSVFGSLHLEVFAPYPSAPFRQVVTSADVVQQGEGAPPLSFVGSLSLDAANNFTVDITFTGGTTPQPTIGDLIARVAGPGLSQQQKRPLLATLEAARASWEAGNCQTAIHQLRAFQNKVRAQVSRSDATRADALIADAQAIMDSACDE
jgi:hypothetical protein